MFHYYDTVDPSLCLIIEKPLSSLHNDRKLSITDIVTLFLQVVGDNFP
jgi:hypothetical protein